ncbi:MAG TPA: GNAT family N-acetyltransferase [Burkholderiaceae bacterium]|nr:GNAT family N-acetyltransferase [Burkholderiaceae bacterium]
MRSANRPTSLQFHDLASHFLALTARDRFLRFGWVMTDLDIVAYVESLLQSIGNVFVVVEPAPDISGVLHLEFTSCGADVGLSVSAWARGKGIGSLLLERARRVAAARGVRTLFVRNLNSNSALRRLAHHLGMQVACAPSARSARLEVPAATPGQQHHFLIGNVTLADYCLRSQWAGAIPAGSSAGELQERLST